MPTVDEWWAAQDANKETFRKSSKGRISKAREMLAQRKMSANTNIQNNLKSGKMSSSEAIRAHSDYNRVYNDAPSEMARMGKIIMRGGQVPRSTQGLH